MASSNKKLAKERVVYAKAWPAEAKCSVLHLAQTYKGGLSNIDEQENLAHQVRFILDFATPAVVAASAYTLSCAIESFNNSELRVNLQRHLRTYLSAHSLPHTDDDRASCPVMQETSQRIATAAAETKDAIQKITGKDQGRVFVNDADKAEITVDDESVIGRYMDANTPTVVTQKRASLVLGGPGTGKGTAAKFARKGNPGAVYINTDDVMEMIPGYDQDVNGDRRGDILVSKLGSANMWHADAKRIANTIMSRVLSSAQSFIFDGTGANVKKLDDRIEHIRRLGYSIDIYVTRLDEDTALRRVGDVNDPTSRPNKTGRFVPSSVVREHKNPVSNADILERYAKPGVQNIYVVNTAGDHVTVEEIL